ncbi:IS21 family transposase [Oribacterium sp. Sow4_G1_1]|uniref:IS21 family transposase n=2 Tax=unclassified Oribacterium TaxID=2629782 RepID=UPI003F95EBCE
MQLDYKDIIIKHYALSMSGSEIARQAGYSKSGVNDFLRAFKKCEDLQYPLPTGITNYGIAMKVYGSVSGSGCRNENIELPDYEEAAKLMATRKNMTLMFLWNRYKKKCEEEGARFYQYSQYCELYNKWCEENYETAHFDAVIAQKMEVDFAGQTFTMVDPVTGEIMTIVVFVAILPYSQYIYAEGMLSTKEPQWIDVNNHALDYFGGVPALVVCDNCKQAVIVNQDWIEPELNKDYADWADHYGTVILPAKVRKPKFKSSVENAVGILEKGFFHKLEERQYFSLEQFNQDLWKELEALNKEPFKKKEHNRYYYWEEEKLELMPLPSTHYEYMERRTATVSSDFHVRFDNAYYSVDKAHLHKKVSIKASATVVRIYSLAGEFLCEWPRATRKGQWSTNPEHLPDNYKRFTQWNGPYFIQKAQLIGKNTETVIRTILKSRTYEVQTYRMCIGILNFTKKYSNRALEECCKQAIELNKQKYTFIKNTISVVADDLGEAGYRYSVPSKKAPERGGYVMPPEASSIDTLLSRSKALADHMREEVDS